MRAADDDSGGARRERLRRWLSAHGFPDQPLTPVAADASFRQYLRVATSDHSFVVMDAPPDTEDCRPFLEVADRLEAAGLRVPRRFACNRDQGFLVLEDLGRQTALQAIADGADGAALVTEAVAILLTSQVRVRTSGLPRYDRRLLERELALFPDWYLGRVRGSALAAGERRLWEAASARLVDNALAQRKVFVHRDFMLRNLMPTATGLAVIDFQDALQGPISYDLAALLRDAFIEWSPDDEAAWIRRYRDGARRLGLPVPPLASFRRDLDWMAAQRHLKVLGIFARLSYRDGKTGYLEEAPRFFAYLRRELAGWSEFASLRDWLADVEAQSCGR